MRKSMKTWLNAIAMVRILVPVEVEQRAPLSRWLPTLAVATLSLWVTPAAVAQNSDDVLPQCQALQVPVSLSLSEVSNTTLYGELCVPAGKTPSIVQLLVHGATYNSYYSDWPYSPGSYSYVRQMTSAGYATFNIERLGYGRSTHPASTSVTLPNGTEALRQVVSKLKDTNEIGGYRFSKVIWVGHSLGTLYGWLVASVSNDVDAFVLTGLLHSVKSSWLTLATSPNSIYSASNDPKFATSGFDAGYLTFKPGMRGPLLYWTPTAQPYVIALDERLKDTVSGKEFGDAVPLFNSPAAGNAPSKAIQVPTLLIVGEHDRVMCDEDGLICNQKNVVKQETPYYSPQTQLQVFIISDTGHDLQLHPSAYTTGLKILSWLTSLDNLKP